MALAGDRGAHLGTHKNTVTGPQGTGHTANATMRSAATSGQ